jgi:hypothetical protein
MSLLFEALRDLAELALGCTNCRSREATADLTAVPVARMGGLVYLSSPSTALHVGVLAGRRECTLLAGRLLGQSSRENLPDSLVRGAMCELAYLLAGGVKRRLPGVDSISVGQPAFFNGDVLPQPDLETRFIHVELDGIRATLLSVARTDSARLLAS